VLVAQRDEKVAARAPLERGKAIDAGAGHIAQPVPVPLGVLDFPLRVDVFHAVDIHLHARFGLQVKIVIPAALLESTYPVNAVGSFQCSDARLDHIWEISARTLKLCMEDTFTDCPLYEQTLWVGDARNESLFAYTTFGATDLARRCITLAGQSLERYPLAGCQVPSSWDCLLPAWSFLWGISVWDYYEYTGDRNFLQSVWGWVLGNLQGAEARLDERGLFSGPYWNMFDWAGIDDKHNTVLHNTACCWRAPSTRR